MKNIMLKLNNGTENPAQLVLPVYMVQNWDDILNGNTFNYEKQFYLYVADTGECIESDSLADLIEACAAKEVPFEGIHHLNGCPIQLSELAMMHPFVADTGCVWDPRTEFIAEYYDFIDDMKIAQSTLKETTWSIPGETHDDNDIPF